MIVGRRVWHLIGDGGGRAWQQHEGCTERSNKFTGNRGGEVADVPTRWWARKHLGVGPIVIHLGSGPASSGEWLAVLEANE